MAVSRWIFCSDRLSNTPSRKCGIDCEKESNYRQQAASLIQDMGQKLQVTQLCINTAIVYMHRFYMFHSFTKFNRTSIAGACLFLAAKVEEQPRKLEHVIRTGYMCTHRDQPQLDVKSDSYLELAQELVIDENILLQTLGFEITVDHPHTHIVKTCNLVRASKDLAQTSYFLATNSLHLTSMCLQYPPTVVACVCIHLACKWSSFEIPQSSEGKAWYYYVDTSVTSTMLEGITQDFLSVLEKCPSKMRKKLTNHKASIDDFNQNYSLDRRQVVEKCLTPLSSLSSSEVQDKLTNEANHIIIATKLQPTSHDRMSSQATCANSPQNVPNTVNSFLQQPLVQDETSLNHFEANTSCRVDAAAELLSSQPALRRVKTESSTLTAKEYFERRERERLERETSRLASKPVHSDELSLGAKIQIHELSQQPNAIKSKPVVEVSQLGQLVPHSSPTLCHSSMPPQPQQLQFTSPQFSKHLGVGDQSDQRPVNIFDCFQSAVENRMNPVAHGTRMVSEMSCSGSQDTQRQQHQTGTGLNSIAGVDRIKGRRRSSHSDSPFASGHKANAGQPVDVSAVHSKNHEQKSSRRKQVVAESSNSNSSPLKLKLCVPEAHRIATLSDQPMSTCRQGTESQERICLKLNVSGGKVEKLTDNVASTSTSAVKLVLSKDKVSGEYQPGSAGHHRHHRHSGHSHHSHKHSRTDHAHFNADDQSRKRAAFTAASIAHAPPEKMLRTGCSAVEFGHQTAAGGGSRTAVYNYHNRHQAQQQQFDNNSTSRIAPPFPPPPLPTDESSAPPPPPL